MITIYKEIRLAQLFKRKFLALKILFCLPVVTFAHLISISATTTFSATVEANAQETATYTVTNISNIPLTGIENQSSLASEEIFSNESDRKSVV